MGNETSSPRLSHFLLKILHLPAAYKHSIVSLQRNFQCNARGGDNSRGGSYCGADYLVGLKGKLARDDKKFGRKEQRFEEGVKTAGGGLLDCNCFQSLDRRPKSAQDEIGG